MERSDNMKSSIINNLKSPPIKGKINIKILSKDNAEIGNLDDNLDLLTDPEYPKFHPDHFILIENPNFNITFSSNYINLWKETRKKIVSNKTLSQNKTEKGLIKTK